MTEMALQIDELSLHTHPVTSIALRILASLVFQLELSSTHTQQRCARHYSFYWQQKYITSPKLLGQDVETNHFFVHYRHSLQWQMVNSCGDKKKIWSVINGWSTSALLFVNTTVTNTSKQNFPNYFLNFLGNIQGFHTFPPSVIESKVIYYGKRSTPLCS